MLARDFVYWLQGYCELTGATSGLDENQTTTVRNHLNLVFAHETNRGTKAYEFCASLKGHFEMNPEQITMPNSKLCTVRAALNNVFEHEIDPAMGGKAHQSKLNDIHTPVRPPLRPGEVLLRC
jgi:hypothetical protein